MMLHETITTGLPDFKRTGRKFLARSQAAAMRMNQAMSATSQQISGGLTTALTDVTMGTKTASQSFKDFSLIAIRAIDQMIIQLMIVGPLMRGLQGGVSSIFGWNTGIGSPGNSMTGAAGDPSAGAPLSYAGASAMGNVFDQGHMIHAYARGDIVNRPTIFPMAAGAGLMGEAGPEAIMPLKRGPDGRLGVAGGSGGSTVNIQMGHIYISAAGADPAVVARIDSTLQAFRKSQYGDTVKIVQDASNRGMRLHQ